MKILKRLFTSFCIAAAILASAFSVYAIGFDAEEIYNSVFVIYSDSSLGSGFAIGENCIITNAHVIENERRIKIGTYSGETYAAFLIAMDSTLDIAVLGVPDAAFTPLKIADLNVANIGDDVYAIGAPNSLAYTLTKGVISSRNRVVGRQKYIQTDAAINTGNSGGPLLTDAGKVIGVNSYKMSDAEGIGLAIPIDKVVEYLQTGNVELDEFGNVAGPVFDITENETEKTDKEVEPEIVTKNSMILIGAFLCSLALNIFLIITLVRKRKKSAVVYADPSERTDFEIEFYN